MINFQFLIVVLKASHHELVCNRWSGWSLSWFTLDMDLRPVFGGKHKKTMQFTRLHKTLLQVNIVAVHSVQKTGIDMQGLGAPEILQNFYSHPSCSEYSKD